MIQSFVTICVTVIVLLQTACSGFDKSNADLNKSALFPDIISGLYDVDLNIMNSYKLDSVYFCSEFGISSYNKSTGETKDIIRGDKNGRPFVYNDSIYYSERTYNEDDYVPIHGQVYRCDLDGSNKELVWDSDSLLKDLDGYIEGLGRFSIRYAQGDNLYLGMSDGQNSFHLLISYNMVTKEHELLYSGINTYGFVDNDCYFTEQFGRSYSIYKLNLTTLETEVIRGSGKYEEDILNSSDDSNDDMFYQDVIASGENIYYTNRFSRKVYQLDTQGKEDTLILDPAGYEFDDITLYAYEGKLYFVFGYSKDESEPDAGNLYEYNPAADKLRLITKLDKIETLAAQFVIIDSILYYESYNNKNEIEIRQIPL